MSYLLKFELPGLPKMSNQLLRGHWRSKHIHAKKWKREIWMAAIHLKPLQPLEKALVTITRCSSVCPDFDGLVSAGKPLIDGLVECGVLIGDGMHVIGQPTYLWRKAAPGEGRTIILVNEVITGEIQNG